jgi:hypothetical protein
VEAILDRHATLAQLFDHEWMHLTVMDPTQDDAFVHYRPNGSWATPAAASSGAAAPTPAGEQS